jgi:hypothetical protein
VKNTEALANPEALKLYGSAAVREELHVRPVRSSSDETAMLLLSALLVPRSSNPYLIASGGVSNPAVYARWWSLVESCSGLQGSLSDVSWYQVPGSENVARSGEQVAGYWASVENRIDYWRMKSCWTDPSSVMKCCTLSSTSDMVTQETIPASLCRVGSLLSQLLSPIAGQRPASMRQFHA